MYVSFSVCGSSHPASLNFCFGLAIGLVIAFILSSFASLQMPMMTAKSMGYSYFTGNREGVTREIPSTSRFIMTSKDKAHEDMDKNIGKVKEVNFDDKHFHKGKDIYLKKVFFEMSE